KVSDEQVESFRKSSRRIQLQHVTATSMDSPVSIRMAEGISKEVSRRNITLEQTPQIRVGLLNIFGMGLGYHLPGLVDYCDVQAILVVEPYVEFIHHSMHVIDWSEIVEICSAQEK